MLSSISSMSRSPSAQLSSARRTAASAGSAGRSPAGHDACRPRSLPCGASRCCIVRRLAMISQSAKAAVPATWSRCQWLSTTVNLRTPLASSAVADEAARRRPRYGCRRSAPRRPRPARSWQCRATARRRRPSSARRQTGSRRRGRHRTPRCRAAGCRTRRCSVIAQQPREIGTGFLICRGRTPATNFLEAYVLNLNSITSPSCTTYSLPSSRALPASLAGTSPPSATKSS